MNCRSLINDCHLGRTPVFINVHFLNGIAFVNWYFYVHETFAARTSNTLHVILCNIPKGTLIRILITLLSNYIIAQPSEHSFDLALMISLLSSELITGENAILQVTVKTEFLWLHLITGYTFISVGIMLPLFYKCTPMLKSFVLKHSFLSFIFACLEMWVMLNYLCVLESWDGMFLSYEVVKYGSLKSVKGYWKAFADFFVFQICITSLKYFIPVET